MRSQAATIADAGNPAGTLPPVGVHLAPIASQRVASWAIYDLANTIFALNCQFALFPEWLTDHRDELRSGGSPVATADLALTTVAVDAAMIFVIILGPWLGEAGRSLRARHPLSGADDRPGGHSDLLSRFHWGDRLVDALYQSALIGFNLGSVVYGTRCSRDVSTSENVEVVSGIGIAVGYLRVVRRSGRRSASPRRPGSRGGLSHHRSALPLVCPLPTFFWVRERHRTPTSLGRLR